MTKLMDFSGSGKLLRAILTDHVAMDALIGENRDRKFCCVVMMEDETEDDLCDFGKPEFGEHVEPELTYAETLVRETAVQQEMDEARIDLVSLNGATGEHYDVVDV